MQPGISLDGDERYGHDRFPAVASYVQAAYLHVATTGGVRLYRRLDPPLEVAAQELSDVDER